jgi:hypothetical protein
MNRPIILTEYPTSGGLRFALMMGEALGIPKRNSCNVAARLLA